MFVYLDGMAPNSKVDFDYRLKALHKAKVTAPSASAALYYEPEVKAYSEALALRVE